MLNAVKAIDNYITLFILFLTHSEKHVLLDWECLLEFNLELESGCLFIHCITPCSKWANKESETRKLNQFGIVVNIFYVMVEIHVCANCRLLIHVWHCDVNYFLVEIFHISVRISTSNTPIPTDWIFLRKEENKHSVNSSHFATETSLFFRQNRAPIYISLSLFIA